MNARHPEDEPSDPAELKAARLLALENSYCGALTARTDRELKQYPEIRYSAEEMERLWENVCMKLKTELDKLTQKGKN